MNFWESLLVNQYHELLPKGKEGQAKMYGTRLLTIAIAMNIFVVVGLSVWFFPGFGDGIWNLLEDTLGLSKGRMAARFLAALPFLIVYPLVYFYYGNQARFETLIRRFNKMPVEDQKRISKRGLYYFVISMGTIIIPLIIFLTR